MHRDVAMTTSAAGVARSPHAEPFVRVSLDAGRMAVSGIASFGNPCAAQSEPWWRVTASSLTAGTGGAGSTPLYLHGRPDGVTLSTSIAAIARVDRLRLDRLSWTAFQYLGYYLGEHTPFARVSALRAGARVHFGPEGLKRSEALPIYERETISLGAAIDRFSTLFARGVERTVDSCPAGISKRIELSAGLDSRHVLAELRRSGVAVAECVTSFKYPPDHLDEMTIARQVAAFARVPWSGVPPPTNRAQAEVDAAIRQGFCSDGGAWWLFRNSTRPTTGAGGVAWFNGLGGDVLAGRVPGPRWMRMAGDTEPARERVDALLARGAFTEVARFLLTRSGRARRLLPLLQRRCGITFAPFEDVVEHVACELAAHRRAGDPLAAFLLWNGIRRKNVPGATCLIDDGDVARMPFLDADVVQFLLSLGPRLRYQDFHAAVFARYGWPRIPLLGEGGPGHAPRRPWIVFDLFRHMTRYRHDLMTLPTVRKDTFRLPVRDLIAGHSPRVVGALLTNLLLWELLSQRVNDMNDMNDVSDVSETS